MKLRNKKTGKDVILRNKISGKIVKEYSIWVNDDFSLVLHIGGYKLHYETVEHFRGEWEDYEEPKELGYWYYDTTSNKPDFVESCNVSKEDKKLDKQIGNYFETEEDAEKAVEKLKALTEAKKDGLVIKGYYYNHEDLVILADIGKCNKLTLDTLLGKEID